MGILGAIKGKISEQKKKAAQRKAAETRRQKAIIAKRQKYLPGIRKIAAKYKAHVEVLDTSAYIYKTSGNREVGIHVSYGEKSADIIRRLEVAFTPSATTSKIAKGATRIIRGVAAGAKQAGKIRKELGAAGKEIKGALGSNGSGNMWTDPNFGKGFR